MPVPKSILERFVADECGATAIEYALLGTLVAVALFASFTLLGDSLTNMFGGGPDGAAATISAAADSI